MQEDFPVRANNLPQLMNADPAIVAAAESAKARIQCAYLMALQKPRNEAESRDRILLACRRVEFAARAEFSKPVAGRQIKGPSIRFAELALREWGNIMTEVTVLYENDDFRRLRVSALDLETNAQFTKDIQLEKTVERSSIRNREQDKIDERKNSKGRTVYILRATAEEMYTKESAWVSKVLRNEGLRLIPSDIIEEGMNTARQTLAGQMNADPTAAKKKLLDSFSGLGISPKELEKYLGHSVNTISPPELISLRAVYSSLRDGEATWQDYISESAATVDTVEEKKEEIDTSDFDKLTKDWNQELLPKFVTSTAAAYGFTDDQLKASAQNNIKKFFTAFSSWIATNYPGAEAVPGLGEKKEESPPDVIDHALDKDEQDDELSDGQTPADEDDELADLQLWAEERALDTNFIAAMGKHGWKRVPTSLVSLKKLYATYEELRNPPGE